MKRLLIFFAILTFIFVGVANFFTINHRQYVFGAKVFSFTPLSRTNIVFYSTVSEPMNIGRIIGLPQESVKFEPDNILIKTVSGDIIKFTENYLLSSSLITDWIPVPIGSYLIASDSRTTQPSILAHQNIKSFIIK